MKTNIFQAFLVTVLVTFAYKAQSQATFTREMRPAVEVSVRIGNIKTEDIPSVESFEKLLEAFKYVRDLRFLKDPEDESSLRRIPWLYVTDGCDSRAYRFARVLADLGIKTKKVFVFGNLQFETNLEKLGRSNWEYHVANIVMVSGEAMVMDPSVDMYEPLPLYDWVNKISDPLRVKISICESPTFSKSSKCDGSDVIDENKVLAYESKLLVEERAHIIELYQDPNKWLGDEPPWLAVPTESDE